MPEVAVPEVDPIWQAMEDLSALRRAEEIKRSPKRMENLREVLTKDLAFVEKMAVKDEVQLRRPGAN
jgi:hypothetical protein